MQNTFNLWDIGLDECAVEQLKVAFVEREITPKEMEEKGSTNQFRVTYFGLLCALMDAAFKAHSYVRIPTVILETMCGYLDLISKEYVDERLVSNKEPFTNYYSEDDYNISEIDGDIVIEFESSPLEEFIKNHSFFDDGGFRVVLEL